MKLSVKWSYYSGHIKDRTKSSHSSPTKSPTSPGEQIGDGFAITPSVAVSNSLCSFTEEEEDDVFEDAKNPLSTFRSQLSKTLPEILADKGALGYFIQFMEWRKETALIKFCLELECLCGATQESLNSKEERFRDSRELINSKVDTESIDDCACSIISNSVSDLELDALSLDCSINSTENSLVSMIKIKIFFCYICLI